MTTGRMLGKKWRCDQPPGAGAERAGGDDELGPLELQHLAADEAGDLGPLGQREGDDDREHAGLEHDDEERDPDQEGDGDHDVDEAHDRHVDPPAVEAGEAADDDADQHLGERGDEADGERDAGADPDLQPDVAAERVGAEPVLPGGRAGRWRRGRWRRCCRREVSGTTMASAAKTARSARLAMAAGLRRKRRQASAQKACGRVPASVSSKPRGRGEELRRDRVGHRGHRMRIRGSIEAVGDVDEEVHRDEEGAEEDGQAHDQRVVEVLHGDDEVAPEAGDGEDRLDDEGAGEDRGDRPGRGW